MDRHPVPTVPDRDGFIGEDNHSWSNRKRDRKREKGKREKGTFYFFVGPSK